ncbi:hypothetical protein CYY_000557 [Polysphondylium violaceum]|uniref:Crinkler family protein n=1 Tax=Polysphondylium violaceum TaxID=133409 RepID=A0A8J4Q1D9_9MYCE|nr:hypothetical protein CYY_000557 [Polysphondylium violaceum]
MADRYSLAYAIIDVSSHPNKEMCKDLVNEKQASRIVYEYGDSKDINKVNQYLVRQFQEAQLPTTTTTNLDKLQTEILFWQQLQNIRVDDNGILSLPNGVHFLGNGANGSQLYIRESYLELKDIIFQHFKIYDPSTTVQSNSTASNPTYIKTGFAITGTPGIGKSCFIYYIMWEIAQTKGTILLRSFHSNCQDSFYLYTYDSIGAPIVFVGTEGDFDNHFVDKTCYYLVDSKFIGNVAAKTIIVSPPDPSKYKEFLKSTIATRRYLPPWSKDELDVVRPLLYPTISHTVLEGLWNKWGGIPRFVLESGLDPIFQQQIEDSISGVKLVDCVQSVGMADPTAPGIDKVIQIIPIEGSHEKYSRMVLKFSSKYVQQRVTSNVEKDGIDKMIAQLKVPQFLHSPLGGSFFESICHRALKEGGVFNRRNLDSNIEDKVKITKSLSTCLIKSIDDISGSDDSTYLLPIFSNFPVVDSIIKPNTLFQVTVSESHPPLMEKLTQIIQQLSVSVQPQKKKQKSHQQNPMFHLYFVVPEDIYPIFTKQYYLTTKNTQAVNLTTEVQQITQYALLLSLK